MEFVATQSVAFLDIENRTDFERFSCFVLVTGFSPWSLRGGLRSWGARGTPCIQSDAATCSSHDAVPVLCLLGRPETKRKSCSWASAVEGSSLR